MKNPISKSPYHYPLYTILYALTMALLLSQGIASIADVGSVAVLDKLMDTPASESWLFIIPTAIVSLLGSVGVYISSLSNAIERRPRWLIAFNGLMTGAVWTMLVHMAAGLVIDESLEITAIGGTIVMLLCVGGPFAFEAVARAVCRRIAASSAEKDWRGAALRARLAQLLWQPGDGGLFLECGLLAYRLDDFARAMDFFNRLGPVESLDNKEALLAVEQCMRKKGDFAGVLACLRRLGELDPSDEALQPRILDILLKLGRNEEALALLDAHPEPNKGQQLTMRQHLNFLLGNYAQAAALVRKIAGKEKPPFPQSLRLYEELRGAMPGNIEILIQMGELLFNCVEVENHERGAHLFEEALKLDPERSHLHRRLARVFYERHDAVQAMHHLKTLFDAYDTDAETYRLYSKLAREGEHWDLQIQVLGQMLELYPDDWRAQFELAHACHMKGALEEAEKTMTQAFEMIPEEESELRARVKTELGHLRRERVIGELGGEGVDLVQAPDQWLTLIRSLIEMEMPDKAVEQCATLIEKLPGLQPRVEKVIEEGVAQTEKNFLLRDYLCDLYFKASRFGDALALYREMAQDAFDPIRLMTQHCEKILTRAPDHLETRVELALSYRSTENWEGVLSTLDYAIKRSDEGLQPQDKALWVEAAFRLGRFDEARDMALALSDEMIDQVGYVSMVLDLLDEMGEFEEAYRIYHQALGAQPDDERLLGRFDQVEENLRNFRLFNLEKKLKEDGELTPEEHYEKAELHLERGENKRAIVHYQLAAEGDHLYCVALAKLAVTLCQQGMLDLADEVLDGVPIDRETVGAHPELKQMLFYVAEELEKVRRRDPALKYYKRIFRIDASYKDVVDRIEGLS